MEGQNKFKRICIFCGSNSGNRAVFSDVALDLGHELVKRWIDLVYGGESVGLVRLISKTVHDEGCHVLGVIPITLIPLEWCGLSLFSIEAFLLFSDEISVRDWDFSTHRPKPSSPPTDREGRGALQPFQLLLGQFQEPPKERCPATLPIAAWAVPRTTEGEPHAAALA